MNSHEVRRLRVCCLCKTVGVHHPKSFGNPFPLVVSINSSSVPKKEHRYVHPHCYIEETGVANLLTLDWKELATIRMCDVPMYVMIRLLRRRAPSGRGKR